DAQPAAAFASVIGNPHSTVGLPFRIYRVSDFRNTNRSLIRKLSTAQPAMVNRFASRYGKCAWPTRSRIKTRLPKIEIAPVLQLKRSSRPKIDLDNPRVRSRHVNRSCQAKL